MTLNESMEPNSRRAFTVVACRRCEGVFCAPGSISALRETTNGHESTRIQAEFVTCVE
jgi:hypothetical protein